MDYVRVTGTIERDGNFTPGWWSTPSAEPVRSGPSVSDVSAKWAAVALDEHEQIIARTPASVLEVPVCPNVPQLHLDAVLAIPATTKAVAIRDGDREAYRRLVPSPARLSLDGPGGLVADQW